MIYFTLYEFTCRKTKLETNGIMLEHKDYISSLNKARKKRNQNIDPRYLLILLAAVIVVGIIVLGVKAAMKEPASGRCIRKPAGTGSRGSNLLRCPAGQRAFAGGGSSQKGSGGDTKDH